MIDTVALKRKYILFQIDGQKHLDAKRDSMLYGVGDKWTPSSVLLAMRAGVYQRVATIEAFNMEHAYELCNLWPAPQDYIFRHAPVHSMSVGDVLLDEAIARLFIVAQSGFDDVGSAQSLQTYHNFLKAHDWGYKYSDDHGAWKKGHLNQQTLEAISHQSAAHKELFEEWKKHGKNPRTVAEPEHPYRWPLWIDEKGQTYVDKLREGDHT